MCAISFFGKVLPRVSKNNDHCFELSKGAMYGSSSGSRFGDILMKELFAGEWQLTCQTSSVYAGFVLILLLVAFGAESIMLLWAFWQPVCKDV